MDRMRRTRSMTWAKSTCGSPVSRKPKSAPRLASWTARAQRISVLLRWRGVRSFPIASILASAIEILSTEARMETTIPAELLELKSRFDHWRKTRRYSRQPLPEDLRQAAMEICRLYPRALVRRVLKVDPGDSISRPRKPRRHAKSHRRL